MKLAAFTLGDTSKASSRLRSFYLFQDAPRHKIEILRNLSFKAVGSCDAIHLQKVLTYQMLIWLPVWRLNRLKIIYDIDDQPGSLKAKLGFMVAIFFSNFLTVDTDGRRTYWKKLFPWKKIIVVPDVMDKKEGTSIVYPRIYSDSSTNFFWIGHQDNISSIQKFVPKLYSLNARLILCTNVQTLDKELFKEWPVDLLQWEEEITFSSHNLGSFMILSHDQDKSALFKSNNKMVLAILSGLIPIVSNTPEYKDLAKLLGLEFLIYNHIDEIESIIRHCSSIDWKKTLQDCQAQLQQTYSSKAVFQQFLNQILI